eukprot:6023383-Prymnesium_polylepis.1
MARQRHLEQVEAERRSQGALEQRRQDAFSFGQAASAHARSQMREEARQVVRQQQPVSPSNHTNAASTPRSAARACTPPPRR